MIIVKMYLAVRVVERVGRRISGYYKEDMSETRMHFLF